MKKLSSIIIACILLLSGCTKKNVQENNKKRITATFYPLYIILMNLCDGAENVELELLAPSNTGCLHDFVLTTGDMKKIIASDILVCNGSGMEEFLEKAIKMKNDSVIIATEGYELFDNNPHIWVAPSGEEYLTKKIAEKLCELDKENSTIYKKNMNTYIQQLDELKNNMKNNLKEFSGRSIITFHEAFPYFAKEFNLNLAAVIEREPGTEPGPKELIQLIETINASKETKPVLFAETDFSSSSTEIISKETGLQIFQLDPCTTGKLEKNSYITAMNQNMNELIKAFSE